MSTTPSAAAAAAALEPPRSPSAPPPPPAPSASSRGSSFKGRYSESSGCQVPFVPAGEGSSFTRFKQLSTRRSNPTRPKFSPSRKQQRTVSSPSLHSLLSSSHWEQTSSETKQNPTLVPPQATTSGSPSSPSPHHQQQHPDCKDSNSFHHPEEEAEGVNNNGAFLPTTPSKHHAMLKSYETSSTKTTPFVDLTQWTVLGEAQEDHPGRRKASGFFQPIRHLSGSRSHVFPSLMPKKRGWYSTDITNGVCHQIYPSAAVPIFLETSFPP